MVAQFYSQFKVTFLSKFDNSLFVYFGHSHFWADYFQRFHNIKNFMSTLYRQ